MKLDRDVTHWMFGKLNSILNRKPDFVIGEKYLKRWYVIPRNRIFNIYLHKFVGDDDDRALHDHPWWSLSVALHGNMFEHRIKAGGVHTQKKIGFGDVVFRHAKYAHRLELNSNEAVTLFITGPKFRKWGFHCKTGWVPWEKFVGPKHLQEQDEY